MPKERQVARDGHNNLLESSAPTDFGHFLRRQRKRRGMTQRQLADLSTLSVRAIRDLETDRVQRPRPETIRLLATALRLDTAERTRLESLVRFPPGEDAPGRPPLALSPIIAREIECEAIVETMSDRSGRLASIAGLPGVGKTRVALEVAFRLHQIQACTVMWAAGARSAGSHGLPEGTRELNRLPERLAGYIFGLSRGSMAQAACEEVAEIARTKPVLLVLDGAGANGRPDRDALTNLLETSPNLCVLGTARAAYRVPGESNFVLSPLAVPTEEDERSLEALSRVPSVRLFLARAALVRPDCRLTAENAPVISEICRRADGVPLLLENLAPWLTVDDLPGLLRALKEGPLDLISTTQNGVREHDSYADALERVMRPLSAVSLDILSWLSEHGPANLSQVSGVLGINVTEGRTWMRSLVVSGLVRSEQDNGHTEFSVLHVVEDFLRRRRRGSCGQSAKLKVPG